MPSRRCTLSPLLPLLPLLLAGCHLVLPLGSSAGRSDAHDQPTEAGPPSDAPALDAGLPLRCAAPQVIEMLPGLGLVEPTLYGANQLVARDELTRAFYCSQRNSDTNQFGTFVLCAPTTWFIGATTLGEYFDIGFYWREGAIGAIAAFRSIPTAALKLQYVPPGGQKFYAVNTGSLPQGHIIRAPDLRALRPAGADELVLLSYQTGETARADIFQASDSTLGQIGEPVPVPELATDAYHETDPALSPDGSLVVFARSDRYDGAKDLHLALRVGSEYRYAGALTELNTAQDEAAPDLLSHDGQLELYFQRGTAPGAPLGQHQILRSICTSAISP